MKQGFDLLVPQHFVKCFSAYELEVIISGLRTIDVGMMQQKTKYTGYSKESPVIVWLWELLSAFSEVLIITCMFFIYLFFCNAMNNVFTCRKRKVVSCSSPLVVPAYLVMILANGNFISRSVHMVYTHSCIIYEKGQTDVLHRARDYIQPLLVPFKYNILVQGGTGFFFF